VTASADPGPRLTPDAPPSPAFADRPFTLGLLFVTSGLCAVAYQVLLGRYVQLIVGATAYAASAVLVAFMLGVSAGSAVGGLWAERSDRPLRMYALAEAGIGLYAIVFPWLFPLYGELYAQLAPPPAAEVSAGRMLARFALGVSVFLLPSFLMGATTPAFARAVTATRREHGRWLARLYGWNTVGGAAGAFLGAYAIVPVLGMRLGLAVLAAANLAVAAAAYRLALSGPPSPASAEPGPGPEAPEAAGPSARGPRLFLLLAVATGLISFGLEVVWTHLLAVLIGNSSYAFGLMLTAILTGLALGTVAASRLAEPRERALSFIGPCLVLAGLGVVLTIPVWDDVPYLFLALRGRIASFALMEATRFAVSLLLMLVPTALLGVSFPLVLRSAVPPDGRRLARHVGLVYSVNTVGAVLGATTGAYLLLASLGSLVALKVLGGALIGTGALAMAALARRRIERTMAAASLALAVLSAFMPAYWDVVALNLGASIYLGGSGTHKGFVLYHAEDPTGGLTAVIEEGATRTLLTNGKFQGDNSEEVPIQHRLANIPTLFTPGRERALVIGLGTGVTAAAVASHGFRETICAEISNPIITAAGTYFADVNGSITRAPGVKILREDGRSILLETRQRYDVISVEVTTIWFAGAGSVYSREFYDLAARRLRRNGVLLQWFPSHHISARNLYVVVNTVRSVFPYVSVWTHRHQGFVVASNQPLAIDLASVRADQASPSVRPYVRELESGSPLELLSDLVVTDRDVDAFLDELGGLLWLDRSLVATDAWPTLEYETPKDVLNNLAYFQNRALFERFRSPGPFPFRGQPTAREESLVATAFVRGWHDPRALPRLAEAWSEGAGLGPATSRWLVDHFGNEEGEGSAAGGGVLSALERGLPSLTASLSASARFEGCAPSPGLAPANAASGLVAESVRGRAVGQSTPQMVVDGVVTDAWSRSFAFTADAGPARLVLRLPRPRRVRRVFVAARALDGGSLRVRILGQGEDGRWYPVTGGGDPADLACRETRVYELPATSPRLSGLQVDLQADTLAGQVLVNEIWVDTDEHGAT
jgi:spermidine synthase